MWAPPKATVAVLTHNRSTYLRLALEALLAQTWGDFELLVLDNASADETAETVFALKDERLAFFRQPAGKGSGFNWASALWMARGDLLMITHDDDFAEPGLLEQQVAAFAQDPELAAAASNVSIMSAEGERLQSALYAMTEDRIFSRNAYLGAFLEEKLWIPMQTCLFRRTWMASIVGLSRRWSPVRRLATLATGDILNAIQLNARGSFRVLKDPLLRYRQHGSQEGRGVDQSVHMIALLRTLRRMARGTASLAPYLSLIDVRLARYEAQARLLQTSGAQDRIRLRHTLASLFTRLQALPPDHPAFNLRTPLDILGRLLELTPSGASSQAAHDATSAAFTAWLQRLDQGITLLSGLGPSRRIAILGSLMVAGILALDAERTGIEVACFLDTSPARQGAHYLGYGIEPVSWLQEHADDLDAVVISSEGDSAEGIRVMLRSVLGTNALPLPSWKDLAMTPQSPLRSSRGGS